MKKIHGMTIKDWSVLARVMCPKTSGGDRVLTVAEYIELNRPKVEYRTSKKGTELIKVYYYSGAVKEYPVAHISTTAAFDL